MGVKDFSKTFKYKSIVKLSDLKNKTIAIDAMTEIWRVALGGNSVKTLTDKDGNPTLHINSILNNIVKWYKAGIKSIWIFDHTNETNEYHNPAKLNEVIRRRTERKKVEEQIKKIKNGDTDELFSDTDSSDDEQKICQKINKLEKRSFCINKSMLDDVKFILSCLSIEYHEAPKGYEGEQYASLLSYHGLVDGVYSGDTDPIPYGATVAYRYHIKTKKILKYTRDDIIEQINENVKPLEENKKVIPNKLDLTDIRRICAMLGTDMSKRTKGVGPKTIMKKYHKLELADDQKNAVDEFSKIIEVNDINILKIKPFTNKSNIIGLVKWLVDDKCFSEDRMLNLFNKVTEISKNDIKN